MNWFQIVFLREDSQERTFPSWSIESCELISNCIFTWGFTRIDDYLNRFVTLWIDFKLYFYVRIHKMCRTHSHTAFVVNWFQIVFLREDSQVKASWLLWFFRCELISNCIFTWGFTSRTIDNQRHNVLWIDFKLYFYVRIHKSQPYQKTAHFVVNWFQIVFLREDSQVDR